MDILSEVVAGPREIQIKHPVNQEPIGLALMLLPPSDPKVKAAKRRQINARLHGRGRGKVTAEQLEASAVEVLVAAIDGWTWSESQDGKPLTFGDLGESPDFNDINLRKLLKVDWIREQADEELGDEAAFFKS